MVLFSAACCRIRVLSVPTICPLSSFQVTVTFCMVNATLVGLVMVMDMVLPDFVIQPCVTDPQLGMAVAPVGVLVLVGVKVRVGVRVGVNVKVPVGVLGAVAVNVGVSVCVAVGGTGVFEGVSVGVTVAASVGVSVNVGVGVGVSASVRTSCGGLVPSFEE